jgi:hypothetical protein
VGEATVFSIRFSIRFSILKRPREICSPGAFYFHTSVSQRALIPDPIRSGLSIPLDGAPKKRFRRGRRVCGEFL